MPYTGGALDPKTTVRLGDASSETRSIRLDAVRVRVVDGPDRDLQATFSLPVVRLGTADDNDLVLHDATVSRYHCELRPGPGGTTLKDLGSTNGTKVHGVRITEAVVPPGTKVSLGSSVVVIEPRTETRHALVSDEDRFGALVGSSRAMRELYGMIAAVAELPATVLVTGESGTGKEMVARTLHERSGRQGPLVVFDAAATDPQMVRSDLFGHERGAFTGAEKERTGAFRQAHKGTLFLDEVGELPLDMQPRLLRVLETRELRPLGSDAVSRVDVRVVAATHRDLWAMARRGEFREDLLHRLAVVPLRVPSLRDRPEDVPRLVEHFVASQGLRCRFSPAAMKALETYPWPGNVRMLRNVLERLSAFHPDRVLEPDQLGLPPVAAAGPAPYAPPGLSTPGWGPPGPATGGAPLPGPGGLAVETGAWGGDPEQEKALLVEALRRCRGNRSRAARELGISRSTILRRIKEFGLADDGPSDEADG